MADKAFVSIKNNNTQKVEKKAIKGIYMSIPQSGISSKKTVKQIWSLVNGQKKMIYSNNYPFQFRYLNTNGNEAILNIDYKILGTKSEDLTTPGYIGDWELVILNDGILEIKDISTAIDIFIVGGGGNGAKGNPVGQGGSGGQGGECITKLDYNIKNGKYSLIIGKSTKNTTAFGFTARAGLNGIQNGNVPNALHNGGNGGAGCGSQSSSHAGNGQDGHLAFGDNNTKYNKGYLYGAGGGGGAGFFEADQNSSSGNPGSGGFSGGASGNKWNNPPLPVLNASDNSGGGGGGCYRYQKSISQGGSGIIIIRNHREKNLNPPEPIEPPEPIDPSVRFYLHEHKVQDKTDVANKWPGIGVKYNSSYMDDLSTSEYRPRTNLVTETGNKTLQMWINAGPQAGINYYYQPIVLSNYNTLNIKQYTIQSTQYNSSMVYFGVWTSMQGLAFQNTNRIYLKQLYDTANKSDLIINLEEIFQNHKDFLQKQVYIGFGFRSNKDKGPLLRIEEMYLE